MDVNGITYGIIGAAYRVHKELGPGLLEKVYEEALAIELMHDGFVVESQVGCKVYYRGVALQSALRFDMLVNGVVIVELKSVNSLSDLHFKQLLTYLRVAKKPVGLLINFNEADLKDGINRVVNNFPG